MLLLSQWRLPVRSGVRLIAGGLRPDGCDRALLPGELSAERIDFTAPLEAELVDIGPEHGFIRPCPTRSPARMRFHLRLGGRRHAFRPGRNLTFDPFEMRPRLPVCRFHPA